ncbi:MAG: hypothetical protein MI919_15415, partial [Holophagales bacterium]|nr:hypothetical protein [Holophagales bacterium]
MLPRLSFALRWPNFLAPFAVFVLATTALATMAVGQPSPPNADYGDAPDGAPAAYPGPFANVIGRFPTLFATTNSRGNGPGAFALDGSLESIGDPPSLEPDARVVDQDDDDGTARLTLILRSIPAQALLSVDVTLAPNAPAVPRYLNALVDLDLDGRWGDLAPPAPSGSSRRQSEWVVRNFRI